MNEQLKLWHTIVNQSEYDEFSEGENSNFLNLFKVANKVSPRLAEEAIEVVEANENVDIVELLDGILDVEYVNQQLWASLEDAGIDVEGAFKHVCDNNSSKFTTDYQMALQWESLVEGSEVFGTCVGEEVYFGIRRISDLKILKPPTYKPVELKQFIPPELLK